MQEILPGVFHWTSFHEGIQAYVHSYYISATEPAVLIDPRVPAQGLAWFEAHKPPQHAYLTNRHHYRHSGQFAERFGTQIWCQREGLHEFTRGEQVTPFKHGDTLPGGVLALAVGVLCPEETALYISVDKGILAIGDAIVRYGGKLGFVPDAYMGDDPDGVKRGLQAVFLRHLKEREFDHLLFAHGKPWIGEAKKGLQRFLEGLRI
ncbi:hypothetical protein [Sulfuricella sp.]|uniref:hypothetical protein n=1 Tax=Sulfuricella sp. TaxID=2099377 RepID=UPI002C4532AC|nr:hypothetical protein [Sulfuricella sp.]HUX63988.1 hypothetical protein [Sulfuricella sp.]